MPLQFDVALRNARLDVFESHIGTPPPTIKIFPGVQPASCAAPDSAGPVLATVTMGNADWMNDAANGQKTKNAAWQDNVADTSGTAGHFRLYNNAGACKIQGSITVTGGGGDMTLDNPAIVAGQPVVIGTFTLIEPHA